MNEFVLQQRDGAVLTLTLNRPERLNALNRALVAELKVAVEHAALDHAVKVVVLAGAGKGFCAGGDVGDMPEQADAPQSHEQQVMRLRAGMEISRLLHDMPKPTIAQIHGAAAGAGLSMALACDLRIASRGAVLTTAFAKVAFSGDFGGSYYLTQLVGPARAKELYFTSPRLSADDALRLGLVSRVVDDAALRDETMTLARSLAAGPSVALGYIKRNINAAAEGLPHAAALDMEAASHIRCGATEDHREAAASFLAKRPPVFHGR